MKRFEKKYSFLPNLHNSIYCHLLSLGFEEVYEKRIVSSIYYDDERFSLYQDSIDGLGNRNKYRLRFYNYQVKKLKIENKIRCNEYGLKEFINIDDDLINIEIYNIFLDQKLLLKIPKNIKSLYKPILITNYERTYLALPEDKDSRVTLDKQIKFGKVDYWMNDLLRSNINIPFERNIMEIKSSYKNEFFSGRIIQSFNQLYLQNERSSKYCNAVISLL